MAGVSEDGRTLGELLRPARLAGGVEAGEELVGVAIAEALLRGAGQHHPVGGRVGVVGVGRIGVDEAVARPRVVAAEVEEGGTAEARRELPARAGPGGAVVSGP